VPHHVTHNISSIVSLCPYYNYIGWLYSTYVGFHKRTCRGGSDATKTKCWYQHLQWGM